MEGIYLESGVGYLTRPGERQRWVSWTRSPNSPCPSPW